MRPKEWPPEWHEAHDGGSHPFKRYRLDLPFIGSIWISTHGKDCPKHKDCGWWLTGLRVQVHDVKLKAKSANGAKREALRLLRHAMAVSIQAIDQRNNGDRGVADERYVARTGKPR